MQIAQQKMRTPASPAHRTREKSPSDRNAAEDLPWDGSGCTASGRTPLRVQCLYRMEPEGLSDRGDEPQRKTEFAWRSRQRVSDSSTVDDERIMSLPSGLLGFPNQNRFALIQTGTENYFFWLQSLDDPNLAFVVTDPTIFFKDYDVPGPRGDAAGAATDRSLLPAGLCDLQQGRGLADGKSARTDRRQRGKPPGAAGRSHREEVDDPPAAVAPRGRNCRWPKSA